MTLGALYDLIIREGMAVDVRTRKQIQKHFAAVKQQYRKLPPAQKKFFDRERLSNPYADTRILYGTRARKVTRALVGIDIEVGELLLADRLSKRGKKIDLVFSHHPEGAALAGLADVMGVQIDILQRFGVAADVAQDLMKKRMQEVERRVHASNHMRAVDAARLLDMPFMCCHTPADNHVVAYLQKKLNAKKSQTVQDVANLLLKEPEYQDAARANAGPKIIAGNPKDKAGTVMVDMTGGTEGSKEVFARLSQAGVKTLVCMHLSEAHFTKVKSEYVNVVIAGHIASDNIGLNLLLDKVQRRMRLDIFECSGFRRVKRARK